MSAMAMENLPTTKLDFNIFSAARNRAQGLEVGRKPPKFTSHWPERRSATGRRVLPGSSGAAAPNSR